MPNKLLMVMVTPNNTFIHKGVIRLSTSKTNLQVHKGYNTFYNDLDH